MCLRKNSCESCANAAGPLRIAGRHESNMETEDTTREISRLRRCINDLVSILALPAIWTGHDSSRVATTLLDVLFGMLDLDFGYVRANDAGDGSPKEWIRSACGGHGVQANEIGRALASYLADDSPQAGLRIANPVAEGTASIAVFHLGIQESVGVFVAGSRRSEFPTETENLLLQVAANQAAIALQEARRIAQRDASTEIERTRAQAALREVEERFRIMADSIHEVIWIKAIEPERVLYTSPSFERIWGLRVEDLYRNPRLWTETIHPEDRDRVNNTFSLWIIGANINYQDVEYRIVRPDGDIRWIHERGVLTRDENGKPVGVSGISTDVTLAKQSQQALTDAFDEIKALKDRLQQENVALREEIDKASMFEEIVGVSAPLRSLLLGLSKVAPTDSTVLITGETGTGKELVARAIHKRSQRSTRAFISVNCAAVPPSLIASELFGHERGAFTGAVQRRQGRFELAEGGTIFLDEVSELPAEIQMTLLRVLQEREFERVGGSRPIHADVRVIAATNRDLGSAVADHTFRADLFYRLNVFPLEVPPLRERRADIPLLVEYFTDRFAKRAGKRIHGVNKQTLSLLQSYDWPGNIRELQNVVERAVILSDSDTLSIDERWLSGTSVRPHVIAAPYPRTLATREKDAIESALMESKGRVAGPFGAALRLGLPPSTLESKIKALNIEKSRFKRE